MKPLQDGWRTCYFPRNTSHTCGESTSCRPIEAVSRAQNNHAVSSVLRVSQRASRRQTYYDPPADIGVMITREQREMSMHTRADVSSSEGKTIEDLSTVFATVCSGGR